MINPDRAWNTFGLSLWCAFVPEFADLKKTNPDMAIGRAFRLGFKGGVETADRLFSEKLKPENRQN